MKDLTLLPQKLLTAEAIIAASQNAIAAANFFLHVLRSDTRQLASFSARSVRRMHTVAIDNRLKLRSKTCLAPSLRDKLMPLLPIALLICI